VNYARLKCRNNSLDFLLSFPFVVARILEVLLKSSFYSNQCGAWAMCGSLGPTDSLVNSLG
jgi:hypothetical protein